MINITAIASANIEIVNYWKETYSNVLIAGCIVVFAAWFAVSYRLCRACRQECKEFESKHEAAFAAIFFALLFTFVTYLFILYLPTILIAAICAVLAASVIIGPLYCIMSLVDSMEKNE